MNDIFYVDGEYVDSDKAVIPVEDLAVLRGYGVFDYLRTYNRQPLFLEAHIHRLFESAAIIGLDLDLTEVTVAHAINSTLTRNSHHRESSVRILLTGGESSDHLIPDGRSRLIIMVTEFVAPPAEWYNTGVKVTTFKVPRFLAEAKTLNYVTAVLAKREALKTGAIEAIYLDSNNFILEGATTNIFFFKGNTLITPAENILPGVTREVILDLAKAHFQLELRPVNLNEITKMDEAFISSTSKEVMPVVTIDNQQVADGQPGSRTRHLRQIFRDFIPHYHYEDSINETA